MIGEFRDLKFLDPDFLPLQRPIPRGGDRRSEPGVRSRCGDPSLKEFAALPFGGVEVGQTESRIRIFEPDEDLFDLGWDVRR